ncbi:MAG: DUF3006 domain-containing protein [Clostridia bacterium]|nr:DUF3006 domain-containing protein [Clostridia bacterium]
MKWIIDRFEEDYAVIECENNYFNVPKNTLPDNLAEGDVLNIEIDTAETEKRKNQANNRLKRLFGE